MNTIDSLFEAGFTESHISVFKHATCHKLLQVYWSVKTGYLFQPSKGAAGLYYT